MNTTEMRIASNRVGDIKRYCREQLAGLYPEGEVESFIRMLFEAFLGWDSVQLLLHGGDTINQSDLLKFHWAVEDLKKQRPVQHIIGYTDFCGCRIGVSPAVLIPRPETEQLVQLGIELSEAVPNPKILDLCTGSGCIAIALAKAMPQAEVTAVELSAEALAMARENARRNGVDIEFLQGDVLDTETLISALKENSQSHTTGGHNGGCFDLIVSNPPYVMECERAEMQANVLKYDPDMALFVPDDDPLVFYRAIAEIAVRILATKGHLAVEINEKLAEESCQIFRERGFSPTLHKDFRDKPRFIICTRE